MRNLRRYLDETYGCGWGCLGVIIFLAILMAAVIAKFCGCAWID